MKDAKEILLIIFKQWRGLLTVFWSLFFSFKLYYLSLLHLNHQDEVVKARLEETLKKIDKILLHKSLRRIKRGIKNLLKADDWRLHLVACTAIVKLGKEECQLYIPVLWDKLKKDGSWVSPQILGLLSYLDTDSIQNFKQHIHITEQELDYRRFKGNTILEFVEFLNDENKDKDYFCMIYSEWGKQIFLLAS